MEEAVDAFNTSGSVVGRYRIVRRLAVGGMGELVLAHTRSIHGFEKFVVLKRILPEHAATAEFVRMFLDEARLAATLDHPNIAHVYDIGEFRGSFFFSMEYVHGQSLMKVMRAMTAGRRLLPLEHALNIVIGTCAGLHYAHERKGLDGAPLGIVHRDVSPPNVILTYDGTVKVVDFGIAKAATVRDANVATTLRGKIPYMSPEQCRDEVLDRRSDIYSIGILLYELTVGKRLFPGRHEILGRHGVVQTDFEGPSQIHPTYPRDLELAVLKALEPIREARFETARDLQIALEEFAREHRLSISSARLASFMEDLFDDESRKWPTSPRRPRSPTPTEPAAWPADTPTAGQDAVIPELGRPFPTLRPAQERKDTTRERPPSSGAVDRAELSAIEHAVSRILDDSGTDPHPLRASKRSYAKVFQIDLDNLEVEDLDPRKFSDPR